MVIEFLFPGTEMEDLGRFYDQTAQVTNPASSTAAANPVESDSKNNSEQPITAPGMAMEQVAQLLGLSAAQIEDYCKGKLIL